MRESSPFDRSPFQYFDKKSKRQAESESEPSEQIEQTPVAPRESSSIRDFKVERATELAEKIAADLSRADKSHQHNESSKAGSGDPAHSLGSQTFADRVRTFFRIPKSISSEVDQAKRSGEFKIVDEVNADETQMPNIQRKPGKLSKMLLAATALGAIGATHEPQIESSARAGIEAAKRFEKETKKAFDRFVVSAEAFIARNRPFGKEAFAEAVNRGEEVEKSGSQEEKKWDESLKDGETKQQREQLDRFERKGMKLSKEHREIAKHLIEDSEYGRENYQNFFLKMELIHGQITQEQFDDATQKLWELSHSLSESMSPEDRRSPIRVAFEVAKQRKTFVRGQAGLYKMAVDGEGNCVSLVHLLLAEVPNVATVEVDMAVQVYTDHVRFLVREKSKSGEDKPWERIDGHEHGVLTLEEMKGTLIVNPRDVMKESLGLIEHVQKNDAGDPIPEKLLGYKTNSMLRWESPRDARSPSRASSDEPIPARVDESQETKADFHDAIKRAPIEHTKYIEVTPELFPGVVEQNVEKPTVKQETAAKQFRIGPKESQLDDILRTGNLFGAYNNLALLEGINVQNLQIQDVNDQNINAAKDIDLTPLNGSLLKKIEINAKMNVKGWENLRVEHVEFVGLGISDHALAEKVAKESKDLKIINVYLNTDQITPLDFKRLAQEQELHGPMTDRITKILAEKKSGVLAVNIDSPFESNVLSWIFNGATGKWKNLSSNLEYGDYLSTELRTTLDENKKNPSSLTIPSVASSIEYLPFENIAFDKLKTLIVDNASFESTQNTTGTAFIKDTLTMDFNTLAAAKNLDTIILRNISINSNILDLSALTKLHFKHFIIETNDDSFGVQGFDNKPGTTFQFRKPTE